ncbi:MAG: hypothetical protein HRF40_10065 [Nitrososphaera sp.]|jgi:hypothetical protein
MTLQSTIGRIIPNRCKANKKKFITTAVQVRHVLKDPARVKDEVLSSILESSTRQLEEAESSIEKIKSILHWAKGPRERTSINIILDDQRKVVKALGRLVDDLSEICSNESV